MEGRPAWDFILEKASPEAIKAKLSGTAALQPVECTFIRKDGSFVIMLIEDQLIHDSSGEILGIRTTLHDISKRKQIEAELENARDAALE